MGDRNKIRALTARVVSLAGVLSGAVAAAKRIGMANAQEVPPSLIGKLPLGFRQLGFAAHADFDKLALGA